MYALHFHGVRSGMFTGGIFRTVSNINLVYHLMCVYLKIYSFVSSMICRHAADCCCAQGKSIQDCLIFNSSSSFLRRDFSLLSTEEWREASVAAAVALMETSHVTPLQAKLKKVEEESERLRAARADLKQRLTDVQVDLRSKER